MSTVLQVVLIVLGVAAVLLIILYFFGRKMESKQLENQKLMETTAQVTGILIIDKKKMKLKDAPLPKEVYEKAPFYSRIMKVCVVKAKIGPRIFNLICDDNVFRHLPERTECKVKISGIYITEILKGAVLTDKELEKKRKEKEKAAKKAAKQTGK